MEHYEQVDYCDFEEAVLDSPVFEAVMHDNVPFLTQLLREGHSINVQDKVGRTPLHFAVNYELKEVFDFMLKLENIHLNSQDSRGDSPLMLGVLVGAEYYVFELLKNGVDVNVVDNFSATALHYSTKCFKMTEALVAKGADMNIQDWLGHTPLHIASEQCECECVIILLLNGADPYILDNEDCLPFTRGLLNTPKMKPSDWVFLEWLYNYTFDKQTNEISLQILYVAMLFSAEYFHKFLGINVVFEPSDLDCCYYILYKIDPSIFYVFMKNYKFIVQELVFRYYREILEDFCVGKPGSEEICTMLCKNDFFNYSFLVSFLNNISLNTMSEDTLGGRLMYLLSYGFILTETDLQLVYKFYGLKKLFKMLLHMDIIGNNLRLEKPFMPHLIYNMYFDIDFFFSHPFFILKDFDALVKFFAHPSLVQCGRVILNRQLSPVPSLVELSRNCTRKNIINSLTVKKYTQFFTVVEQLPITNVCKEILRYERPIYLNL